MISAVFFFYTTIKTLISTILKSCEILIQKIFFFKDFGTINAILTVLGNLN